MKKKKIETASKEELKILEEIILIHEDNLKENKADDFVAAAVMISVLVGIYFLWKMSV